MHFGQRWVRFANELSAISNQLSAWSWLAGESRRAGINHTDYPNPRGFVLRWRVSHRHAEDAEPRRRQGPWRVRGISAA